MHTVVLMSAQCVRATRKAWERKWSFLSLCALVFFASVGTLARLDLLPEQIAAEAAEVVVPPHRASAVALEPSLAQAHEYPIKISVASIGLSASIKNPSSTNITILDEALLAGAVRYPTSAKLGEHGNVVLFGHSSYLPIVHNQAYKTFDGIQNLKKGDTIVVSSATRSYVYAVTSVAKANAESAAIPLEATGRILTLATCDSFGTKSDRFIITAEFVESHSIIAS